MKKQTKIYRVEINFICFLIPTICLVLFRDEGSGLVLIFTDYINNSPAIAYSVYVITLWVVLNKVLVKTLKPSLIINSDRPLVSL